MAVSRADRRRDRTPRADALFGADADVALDLLEVLELAWHDCYAEIAPSEQAVEDVWLLSGGDLRELVRAVRLAVTDRRDLRVAADARRGRPLPPPP